MQDHHQTQTIHFDWSVKDTIDQYNELTSRNFAAVISEPLTKNNQLFNTMMEHYEEGIEILSSYNYPFIIYNQDNDKWKAELHKVVSKNSD